MKKRYEVMPCSASGSHDFHATVIDTHKTSYEKGICECFYKKDADAIALAMNRDQRIREYAAKACEMKDKDNSGEENEKRTRDTGKN
jgi:hypothetical protein